MKMKELMSEIGYALRDLNATGLVKVNMAHARSLYGRRKYFELVEYFMGCVEMVDTEDEQRLPTIVVETYNQIADEQFAAVRKKFEETATVNGAYITFPEKRQPQVARPAPVVKEPTRRFFFDE